MKRYITNFARTAVIALLLTDGSMAIARNNSLNVLCPQNGLIVLDNTANTQDSSANIQKLLAHYEQTAQNLKKSVEGLTTEQLAFIPGEDEWSINQCLEHIILSEQMIFGMFQQNISTPSSSESAQKSSVSDEEIISNITDRSQKYPAPESLQPTGKYTTTAEALAAFKNGRKDIINYIKNADIEKLRSHISQGPAGPIDGYQGLLFITIHSDRHILQIEEIKTHPDFPKNP